MKIHYLEPRSIQCVPDKDTPGLPALARDMARRAWCGIINWKKATHNIEETTCWRCRQALKKAGRR